jgi:pimeloyl-ACP methyl ester carboxylesterase
MAYYALGFLNALKLSNIDALGFSLGGAVVQQVLADRPDLIRKAILVGTGPLGAEGFEKRPRNIMSRAR